MIDFKNDPDNLGDIKILIEINGISAFCLIAQIQLAARHPKNTGISKQIVEEFAKILQNRLSENCPGEVSEILQKGWDPQFDMI